MAQHVGLERVLGVRISQGVTDERELSRIEAQPSHQLLGLSDLAHLATKEFVELINCAANYVELIQNEIGCVAILSLGVQE